MKKDLIYEDKKIEEEMMISRKELSLIQPILDELGEYTVISNILDWELETEVSSGSLEELSTTYTFISKKCYEIYHSSSFIELLKEYEKQELSLISKRIIELHLQKVRSFEKIKKDDFLAYTSLISRASHTWSEAKKANNFKLFEPVLEQIVHYKRVFAEARRTDEKCLYDVFLSDYEPGMTIEFLDDFFKKLHDTILPLVTKLPKQSKIVFEEEVSIDTQRKISYFLAEYVGFDFKRGILKESSHPFSTGLHSNDVRMTTHYLEKNFESAMMSTLHETGHSLYEQSIHKVFRKTILGTGISLGIHESQSRFFENCIGRNASFWKPIYPKIQKEIKSLSHVTFEEFIKALNASYPSLIRTESDELTYSLHIMIRYELEKELISGTLKVNELPEKFNFYMKKYLGIDVPSDREGVLQDIHWSNGSFGYFPSYALGSAYAAQIYASMKKTINVEKLLETGDLISIQKFLAENIQKFGSLYNPLTLIEIATNENFNSQYYIDYLQEKFSY